MMMQVKGFKRSADDLSCASFSIANVVTLMYWTIFFYTSDPMVTGVAAAAEKTLEHGLYYSLHIFVLVDWFC